jgi:hypothetical protein
VWHYSQKKSSLGGELLDYSKSWLPFMVKILYNDAIKKLFAFCTVAEYIMHRRSYLFMGLIFVKKI